MAGSLAARLERLEARLAPVRGGGLRVYCLPPEGDRAPSSPDVLIQRIARVRDEVADLAFVGPVDAAVFVDPGAELEQVEQAPAVGGGGARA